MHGNPDGTKWNWVCDPPRSCACVRARLYFPREQVHRPTEENYWFSFTRGESCARPPRVLGYEGERQTSPPSLGTARSPCIRAGRQWPRVSEPVPVPSGKSNRDRPPKKLSERTRDEKMGETVRFSLTFFNFRQGNLSRQLILHSYFHVFEDERVEININ